MARTFNITNPEHYCPKCGGQVLRGCSQQVCVDGCEMWLECNNCGYEPAEEHNDRVETVWGWQDELVGYAYQSWYENIRGLYSHQGS